LIVSRRKQFSPWRQRQRNKRTARNFSIASSALLNRQALEEVLPVAGVLVGAPLLSGGTAGKAKKEGAIEETHREGGAVRSGGRLVARQK